MQEFDYFGDLARRALEASPSEHHPMFVLNDYHLRNLLGLLARSQTIFATGVLGDGDWRAEVPALVARTMQTHGIRTLTNNFGDEFRLDDSRGFLGLRWWAYENVEVMPGERQWRWVDKGFLMG